MRRRSNYPSKGIQYVGLNVGLNNYFKNKHLNTIGYLDIRQTPSPPSLFLSGPEIVATNIAPQTILLNLYPVWVMVRVLVGTCQQQ